MHHSAAVQWAVEIKIWTKHSYDFSFFTEKEEKIVLCNLFQRQQGRK